MADILSPIEVVWGEGQVSYPYGRIQSLRIYAESPNQPLLIEFSVINYRLLEDNTKEDAPLSTLKSFVVTPDMVSLKFGNLYEQFGTNGTALIEAVRGGLLQLVQVL